MDRYDYEQSRADHHDLLEWEHSEQGSYWAWVTHIARQLDD